MQLAFEFDGDGDVETSLQRTASGWAGPQAARSNCFFAIRPDDVAARQIATVAAMLRQRYRLQGPLIGMERYHVSLHGLGGDGRDEQNIVAAMMRVAQRVSARVFAVRFDQAMSFAPRAKKHALVLSSQDDLPALKALHASVGAAMESLGWPIDGRAFNPHVAMLYDGQIVPPTDIVPIIWTAREFVLIRSWLGQSRHDELGRWPFGE